MKPYHVFTHHFRHFTHFTQLLFLFPTISACFLHFSCVLWFCTVSHLTLPFHASLFCLHTSLFLPQTLHASITPHSCLTMLHLYSLHDISIHPLPLYFPFTNTSWTLVYFYFIYLFNFELFWILSLVLSTFWVFLNWFCICWRFIHTPPQILQQKTSIHLKKIVMILHFIQFSSLLFSFLAYILLSAAFLLFFRIF